MEKFEDLLGKTLLSIENKKDEELIFTLIDGQKYCLYHDQDCCEDVRIEEIVGDLKNLIGQPIIMAEEVIHENFNPSGIKIPTQDDSFTWTFYKIATINESVTIRWHGTSNGYYSETVRFARC